MYDLLRRCVAGELEAEETAAFFTDLATNLVSGALCAHVVYTHVHTLYICEVCVVKV